MDQGFPSFVVQQAQHSICCRYSVRDAILGVDTPVFEIHISNIEAREEFRKSKTAAVCSGCIFGAGIFGYEVSIRSSGHRSYSQSIDFSLLCEESSIKSGPPLRQRRIGDDGREGSVHSLNSLVSSALLRVMCAVSAGPQRRQAAGSPWVYLLSDPLASLRFITLTPRDTVNATGMAGEPAGVDEKKRRVTHSCNICRRKRSKCGCKRASHYDAPTLRLFCTSGDGREPVCGPCASKGWDCSWTAPRKRGPLPGKQVQAKMQRLESHLQDLYVYIPGLQDISEMLLGLSVYEAARANREILPTFPNLLDDVTSCATLEEKVEAFRDQPVGKFFADEEMEDHDLVAKHDDGSSISVFGDRKRPRQSSFIEADPQGVSAGLAEKRLSPPFISMGAAAHVSSPTTLMGPTSISVSPHAERGSYFRSMIMPTNASNIPPAGFASSPVASANFTLGSIQQLHKPFHWHRGGTKIAKCYGPTSGFSNVDVTEPIVNGQREAPDCAQLPPITYRAKLLDCYLQVFHTLVPMCARKMLMQWAYESQPQFSEQGGPELLFAVLACAQPYVIKEAEDGGSFYNADSFAEQARTALRVGLSEATMSSVQTHLLLVLHEWGQGRLSTAWLHLGACAQLRRPESGH